MEIRWRSFPYLIHVVLSNMMTQIYKPKMASVFFAGLICVILACCMVISSVQRDRSILLLFSPLPFAFGIILLGPVLKKQIVEVFDDSIVVHSFRKRVKLDINDLHEIVTRRNGYISYCFHSDKGWFRITPLCYHCGDMLQDEFNRLYGSSHPMETREKQNKAMQETP